MLFNIVIHNTDNRLRNHGFFIRASGVRSSPAYDMNPLIDRTELSLAINEVDKACDISIAMDAHKDMTYRRIGRGIFVKRYRRQLQPGGKRRIVFGLHEWNRIFCSSALFAMPDLIPGVDG